MVRFNLSVALLAALSLFSVPQNSHAVEPSLGKMTPSGLQRGVETEVTIDGSRLADAQEILFYTPGVTVSEFVAGKDNQVKAKLKVAPDCRMGIHAIRMRSATGVSNLITYMVGQLPEVSEQEPNSEFTKPQPIPMNVTISGVVLAEDIDNFEVELKKGDKLVAELEGHRLGRVVFDPYVAILNSDRFELVRSDDLALLHQDCLCSIVAPEDGKYIIQVRETSFGGNASCAYRLHVGNFPRPTAVFPPGGKPGETINVRWIGDPAGEFTGQVTLPNIEEQNFGLHAQDGKGISPSPNMVRVNYMNATNEIEPNDELAEATVAVDAPCALNGIIDRPGDVDYYKFKAKKGEQYNVRVCARKDLRSPLDSVLTVHNSKGGSMGSNDDTGGPDSFVALSVPADGEYLVSIRDHLRNGGPNFVYRIEITPVVPSVTVQLPERVQYIATTLAIPAGSRMPFMFSASRDKWSGGVDLEFKDLPPGMTYEAVPMPGNRSETMVMFSVAADAKPAGKLATVVGKPSDANQKVSSSFHQRTMLVRGNNNREVWGHSADRPAIVLTEAIPFAIDVVQPKAPLLRNGSLDLKVTATRANGFNGPIAVTLAYNPPGIGSSTSAVIPEGKNETVIPMTCNGNAELQSWKIAVIGRASHGGGSVEGASPIVDLNVADQFYNFTFAKAACELGKECTITAKIEKKTDFAGNATAELLGLPVDTSAESLTFNTETQEVTFKLKATSAAKPGKYTQVVCRTAFTLNGETVTTTLGPLELRLDTPLPAKGAGKEAAAKK
jgi:hypothetical protein